MARADVPSKAKLFADLEKFLEDPKGDGYEWPILTNEDAQATHDIIRAILDLKFKPDIDGDQVVEVYLNDRKRGRFVYGVIPHDPGRRSEFESDAAEEAAWRQWFYDATRAARSLMSAANEVLRLIPEYMYERNKKEVK